MLRRIKNLLKDKLILVAIVITIVVLGLSFIKMPETRVRVANIDKVYHSFAYFTLTIVWLFSFYKTPQKKYLVTLSCIFFGIIIVSAMMEFFPVHPAVFMLSLFFMICALVVALMFKSREKKLQTLISGENLLSQWTLTDKQKKKYVDYQFQQNFYFFS